MRRLLLKLLRRRQLQRDLDAELAFHREMSGANAVPLGNTSVIKEQALDLWRFNFMENLWRDLIYAARGLGRNPALVVSALLSLGLGIGVNTAIFSLGVEFLFSEPSVRDAASLAKVTLGGNSQSSAQALDLLRSSGLFESTVGENDGGYLNFNDGSVTQRIFGVYTTKNYFTELGVPMLYGRGIQPGDPVEVAVLGYRFWHRYFNGDPSAVGRVVNLDGRVCAIVGILPPLHRTLVGFGFSPDMYIPRYRDDTMLEIYARLKPGMPRGEALAGLRTVAQRMDAEIPAGFRYQANLALNPVSGFSSLHGEVLTLAIFFAMLLIVVGLVLLIACLNVASLLLARASARRREIATRLALGAGRKRLLQQFLAESLLLALPGAGLGLALVETTAALLARVQLPLPMPVQLNIQPDWRVASYAALMTVFATLACGLLPAWRSVKEAIAPDLARDNKMRLRCTLVAAQIATSAIVLTTGFLFVRNLLDASAINPGFDVAHTLRADVNMPVACVDSARKMLYIDRALNRLSTLPGVEAAAAALVIPFTGRTHFTSRLTFPDNNRQVQAPFSWNAVTPAFFSAMRIPIVRGRTFSATGAHHTVMVNRTFAQRFLGGRQPVGSTFIWGDHGNAPYRITGVVEDTKTMTLGEEQLPQVYEPLEDMSPERFRIQFVVHSAIPPAMLIEGVRRALYDIEPAAGVEVGTMYSTIGFAFLPSQVGAALLGSLGILGLLLAMIGLYGTMIYSVARRTREIGVRIAIGATRGDISRMVLGESARLTAIGSGIGILVAFFITRPLAMFLVPGLRPDDPLNFAVVLLVMPLTGLAASWGPVRRALGVDPNIALRDQ